MAVEKIAELAFTSADQVRDVIHNFTRRRVRRVVSQIYGGRQPKFALPQRWGSTAA
ncbi:hypothetical protein [Nonomuraea candida]|uniref:hypothetical protein n=1 Tax=Nonomuraea candida TaxID=359159 RepID=UPI001B80A0CC|nr:hypothetical protein [Nonomuraea candida]